MTIYDDAPAAGWYVNAWKWPTSSTSIDTTIKESGTNSVLGTEGGNYSGVTFDHLSADLSKAVALSSASYAAVSFDFNPGTAATAITSTLALTSDGSTSTLLSKYATFTNNTWTHVRMPLSALTGTASTFYDIVFFDTGAAGYSFHVDNLALEPAVAQTSVYTDSLASGWSLDGIGWSSAGSEVTSPAEGSKAIFAQMKAAWAGFTLAREVSGVQNPIAAATYTALDFDINPGAAVSPAIATLEITLNNGSPDFALTPFLEGTIGANHWTHVHIPLASINTAKAAFYHMDFFNDSTTAAFSFYLDNVVFTNAMTGGSSGGSSSSGSSSSSGTGSSSSSGAGSSSSSGSSSGGTASNGHESWAWMYTAWQASINAVSANKASFTHISPTFYTVNYSYQSGVAYYTTCPAGSAGGLNCASNGTDDFDGLTTKQITQQLSAAGVATVPAIFGGAANGGTDTGVQNLLNNTNGAATSFITAMTAEAVTNGYAGYNLDWEVGSGTGNAYAAKLVSFVNAFKTALAAHGMSLSIDVISSNLNGTWCSSNNGFIDFGLLSSSSIDRIMIESYTASLGTAYTSCQSAPLSQSTPASCPLNSAGTDTTLTGMMNFMCSNLPASKIVIGLESYSTATNDIAGQAFTAIEDYGMTKVAVWPQVEGSSPFLSSTSYVPTGSNWYTRLAAFLLGH